MSQLLAEDRGRLQILWSLDKFEDVNDRISRKLQAGAKLSEMRRDYSREFIEHLEMGPNLELNAGITVLLNLLTGAGGQTAFNAANARVGVGDSSTAAAAAQTGLQAGTNHFWQGMDGTYPQVSAQTVTFRATIASGNGNQSWQEFINDNYAGTGGTSYTTSAPTYSSTLVALNRLVSNQGTKSSGQTWILSSSITQS
jgi:hypothetical protein